MAIHTISITTSELQAVVSACDFTLDAQERLDGVCELFCVDRDWLVVALKELKAHLNNLEVTPNE